MANEWPAGLSVFFDRLKTESFGYFSKLDCLLSKLVSFINEPSSGRYSILFLTLVKRLMSATLLSNGVQRVRIAPPLITIYLRVHHLKMVLNSFTGRHSVGNAVLDAGGNTQAGETRNGAFVRAQSLRYCGKISKVRRRSKIVGKTSRRRREKKRTHRQTLWWAHKTSLLYSIIWIEKITEN